MSDTHVVETTVTAEFDPPHQQAEAAPSVPAPSLPPAVEAAMTAIPLPEANGLAAAQAEHETVPEEIVQAEKDAAEAKKTWKSLKEQAKEAKEAYEEKVSRVLALIREYDQPSLFRPTKSDTPACVAPASSGSSDDAWRQDLIEVLSDFGVNDGLIEKLHNAQIYKLGEITDYTDPAKNGGNTHKQITDIDGIGPAKAAKIADAMAAYFEARNKAAAEKPKEPEETAAARRVASV